MKHFPRIAQRALGFPHRAHVGGEIIVSPEVVVLVPRINPGPPHHGFFSEEMVLCVVHQLPENELDGRLVEAIAFDHRFAEPVEQVNQAVMLLIDLADAGMELLTPDEDLHGSVSPPLLSE